MKKSLLLPVLFAALVFVVHAQAGSRNYTMEAKAASASALAQMELCGVAKPITVCACSEPGGTCNCSSSDDCGCLNTQQYRWVTTSDTNQTALFLGEQQLGNWCHAQSAYHRLNRDHTWTPCACPTDPPKVSATRTTQTYTYQSAYFADTALPPQRRSFNSSPFSSRRSVSCGPGGCR